MLKMARKRSVFALVALLWLSSHVEGTSKVRIGAFNIKILGKSKFAKPDVRGRILKIARRYDLLLIKSLRILQVYYLGRYMQQLTRERRKVTLATMATQSASGLGTQMPRNSTCTFTRRAYLTS